MLGSPLTRFRVVSLLEGVSYIVLLGVAMPLKYFAGNTTAVPLVGRVHGGLFVLFVIALASVAAANRWSRREVVTAFVAAMLPFGAFWLERRFRTG